MGSQIALGALDMKSPHINAVAVQTFVALLALCVAAAVAQDPCGGTFGSNTYSLDDLNTGTGAGWCRLHGRQHPVLPGLASVWQRRQQGVWPTNPTPTYSEYSGGAGSGVVMTLAGGANSKSCGKDNTAVLNCICDASMTGTPTFSVTEAVDCVTTFSVSASACCPGGGSSSGSGGGVVGWIFVSLFIVGFAVYMVAGIVYKKKKKGAAGMEMVPNIDVWRAFPGYVASGFKYTGALITKPCSKKKGYDEV